MQILGWRWMVWEWKHMCGRSRGKDRARVKRKTSIDNQGQDWQWSDWWALGSPWFTSGPENHALMWPQLRWAGSRWSDVWWPQEDSHRVTAHHMYLSRAFTPTAVQPAAIKKWKWGNNASRQWPCLRFTEAEVGRVPREKVAIINVDS